MKKLIIITGDLAAGKSTYSRILSARYGINVLNKDPIKEVLCDAIGFADRAENRRLSVAATSLMTYLFSEYTKLGQDCILEANFRTNELERLDGLAAENGYETLTLMFRADLKILHQRYLHRIHSENRHPAHLSEPMDKFEDFARYIETVRTECQPAKYICVNADDFSFKTDEKLFKTIDSFMK